MKKYFKITILTLFLSSLLIASTLTPLASLSVGKHEILFNYKMTLSEVTKLFGDAEVHKKGDAAESLTWICYEIESNEKTSVLILSSGELGGGTYITGFELARPGLLPELELGCTPIKIARSTISTNNGIALGMSRNQVMETLGSPTKENENNIAYKIIEERFGPFGSHGQEMQYFIVSSLDIFFENGIVVRIRGFRADQS